jgi:hypothetical protein
MIVEAPAVDGMYDYGGADHSRGDASYDASFGAVRMHDGVTICLDEAG